MKAFAHIRIDRTQYEVKERDVKCAIVESKPVKNASESSGNKDKT
jgi:hypothetical protein